MLPTSAVTSPAMRNRTRTNALTAQLENIDSVDTRIRAEILAEDCSQLLISETQRCATVRRNIGRIAATIEQTMLRALSRNDDRLRDGNGPGCSCRPCQSTAGNPQASAPRVPPIQTASDRAMP